MIFSFKLLNMTSLNECLINILINLIKSNTSFSLGRPFTYPLPHYIEVIFHVLRTGMQWCEINDNLHYSVYHKHFRKWTKLGLFNELYSIVTNMIKKLDTYNLNCFVDSTIIRNICGTQDISHNHKIKSKKGTKITVIVNSKGMPLSFHTTEARHNDVTLVLPCYNKINKETNVRKLSGDKGYISKNMKKYFKDRHDVLYTYPNRKNSIEITENEYNNNERIVNENFFSWITKYRRLTARYDRFTDCFNSFICIAFSNTILN